MEMRRSTPPTRASAGTPMMNSQSPAGSAGTHIEVKPMPAGMSAANRFSTQPKPGPANVGGAGNRLGMPNRMASGPNAGARGVANEPVQAPAAVPGNMSSRSLGNGRANTGNAAGHDNSGQSPMANPNTNSSMAGPNMGNMGSRYQRPNSPVANPNANNPMTGHNAGNMGSYYQRPNSPAANPNANSSMAGPNMGGMGSRYQRPNSPAASPNVNSPMAGPQCGQHGQPLSEAEQPRGQPEREQFHAQLQCGQHGQPLSEAEQPRGQPEREQSHGGSQCGQHGQSAIRGRTALRPTRTRTVPCPAPMQAAWAAGIPATICGGPGRRRKPFSQPRPSPHATAQPNHLVGST